MEEQLWAPWRLVYVAAPKQPGCVFCNAYQGDLREGLVLYRDEQALVLLNRYPYSNGHLLVCPARHLASPLESEPGEFDHLGQVMRATLAILMSSLQPGGCNLGMNLGQCAGAGVVDHFHWHLVPRWAGDTNFMPVLADVRCIPEHLEATWERLRPYFSQLTLPAVR